MKVGIAVLILGLIVLASGIYVISLLPWDTFEELGIMLLVSFANVILSGLALAIAGYGLYHANREQS